SSSPSVSAAAAAAPGDYAPIASTSGVASTSGASSLTNAASGSSPGGSSVIVSTPGSGLEFNNTYGGSCTAAFEACIVAAEKQLESLFTNSVTLNVTFQES